MTTPAPSPERAVDGPPAAAVWGGTALPPPQQEALRRAVRLEWLSMAFLATAVTVMYLAAGSSQAMKAAWLEDMLSFIPPVVFLVSVRVARRAPTPQHPYGYHRSVGVGHLVAATALVAMGAFLVHDSASGLLRQEHPPVGTMTVLGHTVWAGWVMVAALAYTAVPPVLLGRAKRPLAEQLHDRVLRADGDMNKADWMTAVGGIVGILGIGAGLWWADAAAALFIAVSILHDGWTNLQTAVTALTDERARTVDGDAPHPVVREVDEYLRGVPWVAQARSRVRDEGHVLHVECFVVPRGGRVPDLEELDRVRDQASRLDWKVRDLVVVLVPEISTVLVPVDDEDARPSG